VFDSVNTLIKNYGPFTMVVNSNNNDSFFTMNDTTWISINKAKDLKNQNYTAKESLFQK